MFFRCSGDGAGVGEALVAEPEALEAGPAWSQKAAAIRIERAEKGRAFVFTCPLKSFDFYTLL